MPTLDHLGLKVVILVNGAPAMEYPDEEHGNVEDGFSEGIPRFYHYVESQNDAAFSVMLTAKLNAVNKWLASKGQNPAIRCHVDVDGQEGVARGAATADQLSDIVVGVRDHSGPRTALRAFRFASVATVDDAGKQQLAKDMEKGRHLGTIRVRVYRSSYTKHNKISSHAPTPITLAEGREVSIAEKALKGRALSHGSALSPVTYHKKGGTTRSYRNVDGNENPVAIFHFKYRSREALQSELVIPRSRSASVASDLDNLPEEEVRRLAREYLAQQGKRKRSESEVKPDPGLIPRSKRPLKVMKSEGGRKTTIDLTEDDD